MAVRTDPALQVHRKHIRVFKSLRLRRTQKEDLAALWYAWKRRCHALDKQFHEAVSHMHSFLSQSPFEHPVLAAWGAQPAAAVPECTPPQSTCGHYVSSLSPLLTLVEGEGSCESEAACSAEDLEDPPCAPAAPSSGSLQVYGFAHAHHKHTRH